MARIIQLQILTTVLIALVAALIGDKAAGISALLGGLSCALPNALFAGRLHMSSKKPDGPSPVTFFVWEFVKVGLTLASLTAVAWLYHDINWVAFVVSIVVVLKSYIFLLFRNQL